MQRSLAQGGHAFRLIASEGSVTRSVCHLCHLRPFSTSRGRANAGSSKGLPTPRPDYSNLLENPHQAAENIECRRAPLPSGSTAESFVAEIVKLHEHVKTLSNQVKELRSERNALSQVFSDKKKTEEERAQAKQRAEAVRAELLGQDGLEGFLAQQEEKLLALGIQLPNETSPSSPIGGYEQCQVVKTSTPTIEEKAHPPSDHVELLTKLGWLYLPSHITGSSWPYLVKGGALLEMALTQYAISTALSAGYELILPPDVVKSEIMRRCGFNPRDAGGEAQTYFVSTSSPLSSRSTEAETAEAELALAATSEVPLAAYYMDSKYAAKDLPRKVLAFGHAFRAEAGARGRESRGLYRVHQFSKVELFSVTSSERGQSDSMLSDMTELQWKILSQLNLPLRMMHMSTEELGGAAYQKYDIEAWMPGRGSWGELASASNCTDYQARRLNIRHSLPQTDEPASTKAGKGGKTAYCHTLNATAVAIPRLIVALVENGARFDGKGNWTALALPSVLRPFWLGTEATSDSCRIPLGDSAKKSIDLVWT
ncbi:seryl-tRNA synthetase [Cystobasidium minutum MCA 4210]|uniref:seryl-tRNA synthetase n=1 Tax=Cystobasidium minutum MCA 4210 TaxID=1397322 RepID=UPI0034CDECC2|eukprot:jgi/Rhomi1/150830/estExt_Genewise1.C_3_t10052